MRVRLLTGLCLVLIVSTAAAADEAAEKAAVTVAMLPPWPLTKKNRVKP